MGRSRGPKRQKSNHTTVVLVPPGKGLVKRTQIHPYDIVGSDENEFYQVREIKAHRKCYGIDQYLIGWENREDVKHDTWEPAEHLPGSEDDIAAFVAAQAPKSEDAAREAKRKRSGSSTPADGEDAGNKIVL
eukprot:gene8156-9688_t